MRVRTKITLCMVWLLAVALGLGGSLLITQSFETALEREKQSAADSYRMTVSTLQLVMENGTQKDVQTITATLRNLDERNDWIAARLTMDGETVFSSNDRVMELDSLSCAETGCSIRIVSPVEGRHYLQAGGFLDAAETQLRLDVVTDVSDIYAQRSEQLKTYQTIFLILICIGAAVAWAVAHVLTKPLSSLSKATDEIAKGNYDFRVEPQTHDEVGKLAEDFNAMAQQLEANITELQDAMQRQEQFMGSFAHELKTPMTSIIGYADLLRTQALGPEEQMDAANYIFSEGKRLESLSLKLLDLLVMKHQAPTFTRCEPEQLISNLVQHLRPIYAQQNIRLQFRCKPGACMLDVDLVRSLIVNLMDNARKAMDQGGNIFVVSDWEDRNCRIRVLDNGRGMPPEAIAHITEAFYRVDKSRSRAQGGAGLGLALCNEIAQLHDGCIRFDSRVDNGTCVTVVLKGGLL